MAHAPAIFRILLIPAVLLAIWLCPCSQASKPAKHDGIARSCCDNKQSKQSQEKGNRENDCPHCNGGPQITADSGKITIAKSIDFAHLTPVLFAAPVLLNPQLAHTSPFDLFLSADSPPIRVLICTFLL